MQTNSNKNPVLVVVIIVVVLVALLAIGIAAWRMTNGGEGGVKKNQYQAVFLTNGQVYFGKLANVNSQYVELTDIYYLQVQQSVQPAESKDQPQVSLAKLGSELHGPEDKMSVNREQVLFWENLKDDSKVVSAIKENKNK